MKYILLGTIDSKWLNKQSERYTKSSNKLKQLDIKTISIADEDYDSLGCNVLPLSTTKCLITSGNDKTFKIIEENGIEVIEFQASEICYKGSGGPTCLTRPIYRK